MKISKGSMLTEEEIKELLSYDKIGVKFAYDVDLKYDFEKGNKLDVHVVSYKRKTKSFCFCKNGVNETIDEYCPHCGNGIYRQFVPIVTKEFKKKRQEKYMAVEDEWRKLKKHSAYLHHDTERIDYAKTKEKLYDKFHVYKHPNYDYGIVIKRYTIVAEAKKDDVEFFGRVETKIEIVPGEFTQAFKYNKRGLAQPIDLFSALNLNSKITRYNIDVAWDGANNMLDFLLKNKEFTKRTAVLDVFNFSDFTVYKNNFFLLYMYLYSEYPVFELLAKMNYARLISESMKKVAASYNKEHMRKEAKGLEKIFNPYGTTGKLSLNIPKYIGDYLNEMNAHYEEYIAWTDICAYETLSKENFFAIVKDERFIEMHRFLNHIPNLQKYGYKIKKLINYIFKQVKALGLSANEIAILMVDYQKTLELLGSSPDLYPSNIKDVHDKAFKSYTLSKNKLTDKKLKTLKDKAKESIIESEDYIIEIPSTTLEFVEEGKAQHNCVATYVNRVINDECFIFFVRRKDEPRRSYVTAEYRYGKLCQIKEKNNYSVRDKKVIDFANEFCAKLSKNKNLRHLCA